MLLPILLSLLGTSDASAASDIEFKTAGPVLIYIDGQQATLTSKLKQRITGVDAGTHEIRVTGMFGKTLFEAEMDIPDNTMTYAEWGHGELKVLRTEWLEEDEEEDEEVVVAEPEPEPEPVEQIQVVEPEPPLALPAEPPVEEAVAVVEPEPEPEPEPVVEEELELATSLPTPAPAGRTLTVQAQEGMRIEVQHAGQSVIVVVEDGSFRIVDPNGLELALSGQ